MPSEETTEKPEEVTLLPIVLIVLILLAIILLWFSRVEEKPEVVNITGLQIANMSIGFIEGLHEVDGYYFKLLCVGGKCTKVDIPHTVDPWPLYAYIGMYKATNDVRYIEKTKGEMDLLAKKFPSEPQEYMWKIVQPIEGYLITQDTEHLKLIKGASGNLLGWRTFYKEPRISDNPMMLSIEARELAIFYSLLNEGIIVYEKNDKPQFPKEDYLNMSIKILEIAEKALIARQEIVFTEDNFTFLGDSCWIQLVNIELYKATKDEQYLTKTKKFFNQAKLGEKNIRDINMLVKIEPCADSLIQLYELTKEQKYLTDAISILQYLANERWDLQYYPKYNGDNGFLAFTEDCNAPTEKDFLCNRNEKLLVDTGYAVYLFSSPYVNKNVFSVTKK